MRPASLLRRRWNSLAAEHDGAHTQRRLAQVRNLHVGFEGTHSTALIFAHDKFQVVVSWRENEASVVLHVFVAHLLRAIHRKLHGVALVADGKLAVRAYFADHVDR